MELQSLPDKIFQENYHDYAKCENLWVPIEEELAMKFVFSAYRVSQEMKTDRPWLEHDTALALLKEGRCLSLPYFHLRKVTDYPKCPLCGSSITEDCPAVSRVDSSTEICSDCAQQEALNNFFRQEKL